MLAYPFAHLSPVVAIAIFLGALARLSWPALVAPTIDYRTTQAEPHCHCVVVTVTLVLLPAFSSTARR